MAAGLVECSRIRAIQFNAGSDDYSYDRLPADSALLGGSAGYLFTDLYFGVRQKAADKPRVDGRARSISNSDGTLPDHFQDRVASLDGDDTRFVSPVRDLDGLPWGIGTLAPINQALDRVLLMALGWRRCGGRF